MSTTLSGFLEISEDADHYRFELRIPDASPTASPASYAHPREGRRPPQLPPRLRARLTELRHEHASGVGLRVSDALLEHPWPRMLRESLGDTPLLWFTGGARSRSSSPTSRLRLAIAAWPHPSTPFIETELTHLARLPAPAQTFLSLAPEPELLRERWAEDQPSVVHLLSNAADPDGVLTFVGEGLQLLPTAELAASLPSSTRLVVLNLCDTTPVAHALTRELGVLSIGWPGTVSDRRALDFAVFFYGQLVRGASPAEALRRFSSQEVTASVEHRNFAPDLPAAQLTPTPILFVPDHEALALELLSPVRGPRRQRASPREVMRSGSPTKRTPVSTSAALRPRVGPLELEVLDAINPALLLNGSDPIKALRIYADDDIRGARIELLCDAGLGTSEVSRMVDLIGGAQSLAVEDFQFPVLYELLRLDAQRRPVNFRARLRHDDAVIAEETRASLWTGRDEWIDSADTHAFLPAFINPGASAVAELLGRAREAHKTLTGSAELDGVSAKLDDPKQVDVLAKAVFSALRDLPAPRISYISPPPQRVGRRGQRARGQRVRRPAQVLAERRGTCHDLALLFAACLEALQIDPLVVLIPGHTFVGYWRSEAHYQAYREQLEGPQRSLIRARHRLARLVSEGQVCVVESTDVTLDCSFEDALERGREHLQPNAAGLDDFDVAVDVRASRAYVDAME